MKQLTRAEEQIMKVLWKLNGGLLMEVVANMPKPKPHKNTVGTILKTMVDKGFVKIEKEGRFFRYIPAIEKNDYSESRLSKMVRGYFGGSFTNVISFLVDEKKVSVKELELLLKQIKKSKK